MDDERTGMFKWALSGEEMITQFQHLCRGEQATSTPVTQTMPDGTKYETVQTKWTKVSDALMNELGIQSVSSTLYSFLNRNVFLTNLSEHRGMNLARDILLAVNEELFLNRKKYDLLSTNFNSVVTKVETLCISAIQRPFEQGEKKFWKGTSQEIIQKLESNKPPSQPAITFGGR